MTALLGLLAAPLPAHGDAAMLSGELSLTSGYSKTGGWTSEVRGAPRNGAGFEYFRRFSGAAGDILTLDVQARVTYDSSQDDAAWGVELHSVWVERKLGLGKNMIVGHFSPAHGLEPVVDTHGEVLQTLAMQDLGFKKDWGVGYRGILGPYDVTFAGQLGSGMGIRLDDGSFLATAQAWEPPGDGFRYGVSLAAGRVLESRGAWTLPAPEFGSVVSKFRGGAAFTASTGSFEYAGELTVGTDDGTAVAGALLQTSYVVPSMQELRLELQTLSWSGDLDDRVARATTVTAGVAWQATPDLALRAYVRGDVEGPGEDGDASAVLQAYYLGG